MECDDCEQTPCICEEDETRREILEAVLDLVHEKVTIYKNLMQNRVLMIKEDIVTTIAEETLKYQTMINSNISKLDSFITDLQDAEDSIVISQEIVEAMSFNVDLNLDTEAYQTAFNMAINGEFVIFREMLMKSKQTQEAEEYLNSENDKEDYDKNNL